MSLCLRVLTLMGVSLAVVDLVTLSNAKTVIQLNSRVNPLNNEYVLPGDGVSSRYSYDRPILDSGHSFGQNQTPHNKHRHDHESRLQQHPSADQSRNPRPHRNHGGAGKQNLQNTQPAVPPNAPKTETVSAAASPDIPIYDQEFEERKLFRIKQIQIHILQQLHLDSAPNVTGIIESSNPEIKRLKESIDESNENMTRDTSYQRDMPREFSDKKIFIPVEDRYPFDFQHSNTSDIMYFKMSHGEISQAFIHLWIKPVRSAPGSKHVIEIYKVSAPVDKNNYIRMNMLSVDTVNLEHNKGSWIRYPVFAMVADWATNPDNNLGMIVIMKGPDDNQIAVTNSKEEPEKAPLLEVQFIHESDKANRLARSPDGGKCSLTETRCCRFPLPVNFTEHNFDFIVAPKVYMANFCNGTCDYLYAQQHIHMAMVQKIHSGTATHGPCCGAKELMPLNMLYYDHDRKIRFDTINDMIIEKCSCD
ncbi:growth/differentiation factor 8-like [Hyalella azteca]|uniref:Growth/differentiation factor 8-like n=1 Tax=Hyalella azteca TaxID=294128 RepID=A0A8B7P2J6_HYAAZ|nr:growth/differentiation factor 8-like [Hyalella azteca]